MKTPFFDAVARASRRGPRFFVPGHKGNPAALPPLAALLSLDLTELDGLDDLSHPCGPLAQSQANMAQAFGAGATLYAASGSTACILAMLAVFVGQGGRVVMARGCHVAAVRGLALLGATPHWVALQNGLPTPAGIDAALTQSGAKAVYVTTIDYCGHMADIPALAAVCQRHGAALLCDNAHGAFLRFMQPDRHPLTLGADAAADSAHKTLACLIPAALLHLKNPARAGAARQMLNLFSSTSPSYPVLASLDIAAGQLLEAPPDFAACAARLAQTAASFAPLTVPCADPLRLHLRPALAGYSGRSFVKHLRTQGIYEEYFDGESLIFMAAPANTEADFAALEAALDAAAAALPRDAAAAADSGSHAQAPFGLAPGAAQSEESLALPAVFCDVRQAFFSPQQVCIPVASAAGRVMAGICAPCPPGVPLVMPGERITAALAARMAAGGILQVDVLK